MKQAKNTLKCKALLMKITKTASSFSFSVPFDVINSSTLGFKTGANCQTSVLKRIKKKHVFFFCVLSQVFRKY